MKTRWVWVCICVVLGLLLLGIGLVIPVHLRAVDASVVLSAGRAGESLLERGRALADGGRLGAAQIYVSAAKLAEMPGWDRLGELVTNRAMANPGALYWGHDRHTPAYFQSVPEGESFSGFIVQRANREAALAQLDKSSLTGVQELLQCRALNHTVLFPPSSSASGQAFDAVVAECGLLLDGNFLSPTLASYVRDQAASANHGRDSQPIEQLLLDLAAMGEHLNWDQLTLLMVDVPDAASLHQLAGQMDAAGGRMPLLYAAAQLTGKPAAVAQYVVKYPKTGLEDISSTLRYGGNGLKRVVESGQRFYVSDMLRTLAAYNPVGAIYYYAAARSVENPWLVLAVKWLCYLLAGFSFAAALHFMRPPLSGLELPLRVRGFHLLREFLFSLGFLLVVLILSEPFLAQDSQKEAFSFRLHLPMAGAAIPSGIAGIKQTVMNPTILLTLLVFFVLQLLIYISCLVKLAEIRRQQVPPRMKLKLLENEEHLFDAGLYLGFVGTIVSLIVASMGLVKFSLMAAYSSTSFGIIFVVIFKIFHLRPARRKLLLEAELSEATAHAQASPGAGVRVSVAQPA